MECHPDRTGNTKALSVRIEPVPSLPYSSFADFNRKIILLKLTPNWSILSHESLVVISCNSSEHLIPKYEIFVQPCLTFTLRTFGCMLTDDHSLYSKYKQSFANVTLTAFIKDLDSFELCQGVTVCSENTSNFVKHVIPKVFSFLEYMKFIEKPRFHQNQYLRSGKCALLIKEKICSNCCKQLASLTYESKRRDSRMSQPAKLTAPISMTSPLRVKLALQESRLKCRKGNPQWYTKLISQSVLHQLFMIDIQFLLVNVDLKLVICHVCT